MPSILATLTSLITLYVGKGLGCFTFVLVLVIMLVWMLWVWASVAEFSWIFHKLNFLSLCAGFCVRPHIMWIHVSGSSSSIETLQRVHIKSLAALDCIDVHGSMSPHMDPMIDLCDCVLDGDDFDYVSLLDR